jgi:hypothetical protein
LPQAVQDGSADRTPLKDGGDTGSRGTLVVQVCCALMRSIFGAFSLICVRLKGDSQVSTSSLSSSSSSSTSKVRTKGCANCELYRQELENFRQLINDREAALNKKISDLEGQVWKLTFDVKLANNRK